MRAARGRTVSGLRVAMLGLRAPWGTEGGVEQSVGELAPRLVARGIQVTVYCRARYNPHGPGFRQGVRLVDTGTVYSRSLEAILHTGMTAPRASMRADLVHLHACGPALFAGVPPLFGRASVVTLHGKDWEREKWGAAARAVLRSGAEVALRNASELIVVSRGLESWCRERSDARVTFIPNGVGEHHPVAWEPSVFPELRRGQYHLFLGRLVPEKELVTLLRAVERKPPRMPVVITGGGSYTPEYVERLHREAPPGVVFTGPRFGMEKAMLLTHARSFLFPSRVEGLPIALLEALAAGLPTLASDIGPNLEVLGEIPGWRLPVGDVAAWCAAIHDVEDADPVTLAEMGRAGRRRVAEAFGWDAVVEATRQVYTRAAART
jgi:glycosyltransferase involved in cell wall biosynthesis